MKIAIDIGHARMTGARGCGREEHELCSRMAPVLKKLLAKHRIEADVIDFPDLGNKVDLAKTVDAINKGGYDASISLHCDASDNPDAHGAHVCYVSAKGSLLATEIAKFLCVRMPGRSNATRMRKDLYVLNNTKCPAVLVECGFITNVEDCLMLDQEQEGLMHSIALGVYNYREKTQK